MLNDDNRISDQSDRPFRHRRTARRHRPDRPQDHRRQLRRHGPSRRRRIFRARTRARSIAAPLTWAVGWRRTSSPPGLATRCEIQFAYAIGYPEPGQRAHQYFRHRHRATKKRSSAPSIAVFSFKPADIIKQLEPAPPDLLQDHQLRPLRQDRRSATSPGKKPIRPQRR